MRLVLLLGWLIILVAGSGMAGADLPKQSLPPSLPKLILDGDICVRWASAHTEKWSEMGVNGFLIRGVVTGLDADCPALLLPPRNDSKVSNPLRTELRKAMIALEKAGVDTHFLHVPLAPDLPYYDGSDGTAAILRFRQAATFAKSIDCKGIALDSHSTALFQEYRWDGYEYGPEHTPAQVEKGARNFGRALATAFGEEWPEGELLILSEALDTNGPLWWPMLAGVLEGLDLFPKARMHMLVRSPETSMRPEDIIRKQSDSESWFSGQFDVGLTERWRQRGGSISLGLRPLVCDIQGEGEYRKATVSANCSQGDFREQFSVVQMLSRRYVWIDSADGPCWWRVKPEEATKFAGNLQMGGDALIEQSQTEYLMDKAYSPRMPYSGWRRVGWFDTDGALGAVLTKDRKAGLLLWREGTKAITVPDAIMGIPATSIRTDETRTVAVREGHATLTPIPASTFFESLPNRTYVLPASVWFSVSRSIEADMREVTFDAGFANRTGLAMSGSLEIVAPEGMYARPKRVSFGWKDGKGGVVNLPGVLRGRFRAGTRPEVITSVILPGTKPFLRTHQFEIPPQLRWQATLADAVIAAPCVADINLDKTPEIVAASRSGEIAAFRADGTELWRQWLAARMDTAPDAGELPLRIPCIVAADRRGRLHLFARDGVKGWEASLDGAAAQPGARCVDMDRAPGKEILCATQSGTLYAYRNNSQLLWKTPCGGPVIVFAARSTRDAADATGDIGVAKHLCAVVAVSGPGPEGSGGQLLGVADSGAISWITPVESRVSGGLIFADMNGDGADEVGGGFSDGSVRFFNPEDGSHSIFVDLTGGDAIRAVHADNLRGEATPELFLASSGRLRCIEDGRTVAWEYELSGVQSVVTAQLNDGARVLATTERGALVCLTAQGLPEWTDTRATAGIAGAPIVADFNQDDRKEAVTASRDHHLRVIDLCDPSPLEKPKVIRKPMTGTQ